MKSVISNVEAVALVCFSLGFMIAALLLIYFPGEKVCERCQCNSNATCNVSYGGHTMSVEDALERAGEGLTVDQWKEVGVMIDNALNESWRR
jgi:hypothetical protein